MATKSTLQSIQIALSFVVTNENLSREISREKGWSIWEKTISEKSKSYYESIYYGNFFHQAFIADGNETAFIRKFKNPQRDLNNFKIDGVSFLVKGIEVFSEKSGFNLFNLKIESTDNIGVNDLTLLMLKIRNSEFKYEVIGGNYSIEQMTSILGELKTELKKPSHLYSFLNVEYSEMQGIAVMKEDCFHLANFIPFSENSHYQTSHEYWKKQHNDFGINIYSNWYALSLNDSFVRVSSANSDPYDRWKYDYFTIYIYHVCLKNYLSHINSQLKRVTDLGRSMERKKNEFTEFLNDTQYHRISSKFLPNELFEIIGHSLGIKEEMQILEKKIERMNNYFHAKRNKAFNTALIIITFLSVFTVIYDTSMWFDQLGVSRELLWPTGSLITAGVITVFILIFFILRLRK